MKNNCSSADVHFLMKRSPKGVLFCRKIVNGSVFDLSAFTAASDPSQNMVLTVLGIIDSLYRRPNRAAVDFAAKNAYNKGK